MYDDVELKIAQVERELSQVFSGGYPTSIIPEAQTHDGRFISHACEYPEKPRVHRMNGKMSFVFILFGFIIFYNLNKKDKSEDIFNIVPHVIIIPSYKQ